MRIAAIALMALLAVAPGAGAQTGSLRGQWDMSAAADPTYTGIMLVDAQHRATFDASGAHGRAQSRGYAKFDGARVEIILTNGTAVSRFVCAALSSDLLECRAIMADGRFTVPSILKRIGPGPVSLMPASR